MAHKTVLDTSAILRCGHDFRKGDFIVSNSVLQELKLEKDADAVAAAISSGYVNVIDAGDGSKAIVVEAAKKTGDLSVLSNVDIDVLALAHELDAVLASDDYAIQNTAKKLGIKYVTTSAKGIEKEIVWVHICSGCGKKHETPGVCEVCGHNIIRRKS